MARESAVDNKDLAELFNITEQNLAERREFIRLGESERQLLMELIPWAKENASAIAEELYDWQFTFGPTRDFFHQQAQRKHMSMEALRRYLETAQAAYFVEVFEGSREHWGVNYFRKRLVVGQVHDAINLPSKWYIGTYSNYLILVKKYLAKAIRKRDKRDRALEVISKVFNYDIQAVSDSYLLSVFRSMGVRIESVGTTTSRDRTEQVGPMKASISTLIREIAGGVKTVASFAEKLSGISEELSGLAATVASATEQLGASIREISSTSHKATTVALSAVDKSQSAELVIGQLDESSGQIGKVIQLINKIAEQTNLLALNATIEAARAGEAGKGFAVVAGEVKELSGETAKATLEIEERIQVIQGDSTKVVASIAEISRCVQDISDNETTIAAAVEEQSSVVTEISRNAHQTSSSSEQTRYAAKELQQLADTLSNLVAQFDFDVPHLDNATQESYYEDAGTKGHSQLYLN